MSRQDKQAGSVAAGDGREVEIKLAVPAHALEPLRLALAARRGVSAPQRLVSRYYDTADRALARSGAALRLRLQNGCWVQTFKVATGDSLARVELECERDDESLAPGAFDADPRAGALRSLVDATHDPMRGLLVRFETDFMRTALRVRRGGAQIEIALDEGSIRAGQTVLPICELEFECLAGSPQAMLRLAREWALRFGLWIDPVSKAERGDRLERGLLQRRPRHEQAARLARRRDAQANWSAMFDECIAQLLISAAAIAAADPDVEHLHGVRISIRRLRALCSLQTVGWPVPPAPVMAMLRKLANSLGERRDADVFKAEIWPALQAAACPVFELAPAAESAPASAMADTAAQRSLFDLLIWRAGLADETLPGRLDDALARTIERAWRRNRRQLTVFDELDSLQRHRLRRQLRRMRYLAELAGPLVKGAKRRARMLASAQRLIGGWADQRMAEDLLNGAEQAQPGVWFARGWLAQRRELRERQLQLDLDELLRASKDRK